MNNEHPDAKIIALGIEYDKFAANADKLSEEEPISSEEIERLEDDLFAEGYRLGNELSKLTPKTLIGVDSYLRAIDHMDRWAGMSSADRARHAGSAAEAAAWQVVAAVRVLRNQLGAGNHAEDEPTAELV